MAKQIDIIHCWSICPHAMLRDWRQGPNRSALEIGQKLLEELAYRPDYKTMIKKNVDIVLSVKTVAHMLETVSQGLPLGPFQLGLDSEYRVHVISHNSGEEN